MKCRKCGSDLPPAATFCGQCGARSSTAPAPGMGTCSEDMTKTRALPSSPQDRRGDRPDSRGPSSVRGLLRYLVDIVFLFDATGSMGPFMRAMQDLVIGFVLDLEANNIDAALGLVEYRDEKIGEPTIVHGMAKTAEEFRGWISALDAHGGGDEPESGIDAGYAAMDRISFRDRAARIFVWITDASSHDPGENGRTIEDLPRDLASRKILAYVIGPELPGYLNLAGHTGGLFYRIDKNPEEFRRIVGSLRSSITDTVAGRRDMKAAAEAAMGRTRVL